YALSDRRPGRGHVRPPAMVRQLLDLQELATGRPAVAAATPLADAESTVLARILLPQGPDHVGLVPGAGGRIKCWPLERFLELGRRIAARGRIPVFLLGPAEADWAEAVRAGSPGALLPLQDPRAA